MVDLRKATGTNEALKLIQAVGLAMGLLVLCAGGVRSQAAGGPDDLAHPERGPGDDVDADEAWVPGELLLRFRDGTPRAARNRAARAVGARSLRTFPAIGVDHWRLPSGLSVERALEVLSRSRFRDDLIYAEPNYILGSAQSRADGGLE